MKDILTIMSWSSRFLLSFGLIFISVILTSYSMYKKQQREISDLNLKLDIKNEKLKQRLEPIIEEIVKLIRNLHYTYFLHSLPTKASHYLIQKWLDDAKISKNDQSKYFSHCICLPTEFSLARDCYVLLNLEDTIGDSRISDFLSDAQAYFKNGIEEMRKATGVSISSEFSFKRYSLEEALAKNDEEILDPTDIVVRVKKALMNVNDYVNEYINTMQKIRKK